jgi:penicillin amidase
MKRFLAALLLVVGAAACSSPTSQYLNYRLAPDTTRDEAITELAAEGLDAPAETFLDRWGVPHIRAGDERAIAFALGYMHARDRRFQMETLRLLAAGRLRELIGDNDHSGVMARLEVFSRMIGLERDAQLMLEKAPPEDRALLEAYASGVNLATRVEPRPLEFRLLNYTPEPWTTHDSTLITALVSFGLNKNWEQELTRLEIIVHQLRTGGSAERALAIWRPRFDLPPHLIGKKPAVDPFAAIPPIAPELVEHLSEYAKKTPAAPPQAALIETSDSPWDGFTHGGSHSNNWAMSGAWTGTGKGAFAGDPHMPHQMPPLGYLAHLKCDGGPSGAWEAIGAGFVGLPAIAFGTNGKVAWGPTSNWADVADLYVEKPAPGKPGFYEYRGQAVAFETREEVFRIRRDDGGWRTETRTLRASRHGVVLNDFIDRLPADFPIVTLRREGGKGKPITALRNLYKAVDVHAARLALLDFTAMVGHWSLADAGGRIAYCGPVLLPKRTRHLGTVPVPGWTGTYEWDEFVPIDQMPYVEGPPQAFVGTANNQVIQPESTSYPINLEGDAPHRYARIAQILGAGNNGKPIAAQIAALQSDNVDLGWPEARPVFARALEPLTKDDDRTVAEAARRLLAWDGRTAAERPEPTIFHSLVAFVVKRTLEDEVSPATMDFLMSYFNAEPLVFGILADPGNPAWDDRRTPIEERAEGVIEDCFRQCVAALTDKYGEAVSAWRWREAAPFILAHPFGSQKALASYLNRGPLPTNGAGNTVYKNQFPRTELTSFPVKYGPVLRVAVDLSDLKNSRMSLPGGQSGRPASKHYDDLLPLFLAGEGVSMDMDFDRVAKAAVGRLTLKPAAAR